MAAVKGTDTFDVVVIGNSALGMGLEHRLLVFFSSVS